MKEVKITTEYIKLGQLLKLLNYIQSGGEEKQFVLLNKILVNGELESRRGRKIYPGYEVIINKEVYKIL